MRFELLLRLEHRSSKKENVPTRELQNPKRHDVRCIVFFPAVATRRGDYRKRDNRFSPDYSLIICSCKREAVEMTRMAAEPLVQMFPSLAQWISCHSTSGTRVQLTHECLGIFKCSLKCCPLLPDARHSSDELFIALKKFNCFPLPFTREGRDGMTSCDRDRD